MQRVQIPIRPGGMLADVNENDLGTDQHIEVANFKEIKENEWEIVKGLAAEEVTDDLSGDRFFILQDGTGLKKIDYDATNSPLTGYENETPDTLSLPSGVTIGADDTCRFFVHNGVVRITGSSEPIWYGYIQRKLFYTGYVEVDKFFFESGSQENNFTGVDATVAADATWGWKHSSNSMKITTTGAGGYAYRQITAKTKGKYRLYFNGRKTGGPSTDDWFVYVGTTPGGGEIVKTQFSAPGSAADCLFEFDVPNDWDNSTTTIYISLIPQTDGGSGDYLLVDNWLLQESYPQLTIQDWKMEKAALDKFEVNDLIVLQDYNSDEQGGTSLNTYCKFGVIYDRAQYSLMNIPSVLSINKNDPGHLLATNSTWAGRRILLRFQGSNLLTSFLNYRITGALLILGTVVYPLQETDPSLVWRVIEFLDFTEHPPDIEFIHDKVHYETATANRLYLRDTGKGANYHTHWEDGYFQVGAYVHLRRGPVQWISKITTVSLSAGGTQDYIEIEDAIFPYFFAEADSDGNFDEDDMWIKISRLYDYDSSDGFDTNVGVEISGGDNFWDFTSIPAGTIENTPDYTHHRVIDKIAYALSKEEAEQDIIRYSPINQPDNLPVLKLITTPVGDIDRNLALIERDGRFVTLKRKSVAQGQFTSNSYYHDKDGVSHGLYATEGYIVIDDVLYFMDIDDIYMFNGVEVQPFMQNSLMRSLYVANVHTGSFFAYKPLDKELWLVLNGIIIVYDFERRNFYLRETAITPVRGFTDYDQRLFLYSDTKFTLYDHSQATFDESMQASFKTRIVDLKSPQHLKHLKKIYIRMISNTNYAIDFTDKNESAPYESDLQTPPTSNFTLNTLKPKYLFREGYLEFQTTGTPSDLTGTIKTIDLVVQRWKSEP
jgi:hypothetical protein